MKQIIIENQKFDFDLGCGMLKLKYKDECPFPELQDIWSDIKPLTFKEIAVEPNLEKRRLGIRLLGIENIIKDVNPKLKDKKTMKKQTTWVNKDGELESINFNDTYELYEVDGSYFAEGMSGWRRERVESVHYVKCKDTSTNREYYIWVDLRSVWRTNNPKKNMNQELSNLKVNAIECIAWTIQTNLDEGSIEKLVRQGDCVLLKPTTNAKYLNTARHLTENEYRKLLVAES